MSWVVVAFRDVSVREEERGTSPAAGCPVREASGAGAGISVDYGTTKTATFARSLVIV